MTYLLFGPAALVDDLLGALLGRVVRRSRLVGQLVALAALVARPRPANIQHRTHQQHLRAHLSGSALLPPDTHSCWTSGFSLQYQQVNDIPSTVGTGELVSIVVVLAPSSCGRRFESPGNV